jgi:hypothetical protein
MEVGGFDVSFICRPAPPPAPTALASAPPLSPSQSSTSVNGTTAIHLLHNQQVLTSRNKNGGNLFFIPSLSNKFSQEIIHLIVTYSSTGRATKGINQTTELKEVITLERLKSNPTTTQFIEMKKKDITLHFELQYSWISLELIDFKKLIASSQVSPPLALSSPLSLSLPHLSPVFPCIS